VDHTPAKLYIPKEIKNGKKVISLKKPWYVWFRYRIQKLGNLIIKVNLISKLVLINIKPFKGGKLVAEC
jgi:hypothetical protein